MCLVPAGVLTNNRVRLLFDKDMKTFRPRRKGERKRKSVRGCIVDSNLSVVNLVIVKKGEQDLPGLTDTTRPRRLGPKRASRIRKLFNLTKDDDVRKYVIRRTIEKGDKKYSKAPKIQRLVTPQVLQRKRARMAFKKDRREKVCAPSPGHVFAMGWDAARSSADALALWCCRLRARRRSTRSCWRSGTRRRPSASTPRSSAHTATPRTPERMRGYRTFNKIN
jgi:hypothetical protein